MTVQEKITTQDNLTLTKRPAEERGKANFGWLKSAHSFSFGRYYDPKHLGFGNLIVINDDLVAGGKGFGAHPHQNAEIFSYVMGGALEHKDSLGNGSVVSAGGVQYMSAGAGVTHSEFNPSQTEEMRFLQVWLLPEVENTTPAYADASVYAATLRGSQSISQELSAGRKAWVQVADGSVRVNGVTLNKGDGLAVEGSGVLTFDQGQDAEFLVFDLAP